jgi:3-deoxy-manno-octulosonate cytidylyltransferase (CMP-KDO synthetase)
MLPESIDAVVNFQGDAPLTPPWILEALIQAMKAGVPDILYTPAVELTRSEYDSLVAEKAAGSSSGTLVVFDAQFRALYFSKQLIPYVRKDAALPDPTGVFRHIGMYGYSRSVLQRYLELPQTSLEKLEGLEQLRALGHGVPIQVVPVDYRGRSAASIDNPEDVALVEGIIATEGELVP